MEPTKIGPYTLVKELGRGGMAQVWLARRIWEDGKIKPCVIKFPRKRAALNPAMLRQFEQEATLSMQVQHDNIVQAFDTGNHDGLPYLVLAYVAGRNLLELILGASNAGQPWDVNTAVHIAREVGYALVHAHEMTADGKAQRLIHRDVASKNVMISLSGGVLLTDFGVATSVAIRTTHNHIKGTLPYMAPEHYLGNACPASDAFGLGAILWEMLEGRPFRSDVPEKEMTASIVEGSVPALTREVPSVVRRVVEGLLGPDVLDRMRLRDMLVEFEDFPNRRMHLQRMMAHLAGGGVQASGLSKVHFAASPELVQTLAAVKAAGVPLSELQRSSISERRGVSIPSDFVPEPSPRTIDIAPPSLRGPLDDDAVEDEVEAPAHDSGATTPTTVVIGAAAQGSSTPREVVRTVRFEREIVPQPRDTLVVTVRVPRPSVSVWEPRDDGAEGEGHPVSVVSPAEKSPQPHDGQPPAPSEGAPVDEEARVEVIDVPQQECVRAPTPPSTPTHSDEVEQTNPHELDLDRPASRVRVSSEARWMVAIAGILGVLLLAGLGVSLVQRWRPSPAPGGAEATSPATEPVPEIAARTRSLANEAEADVAGSRLMVADEPAAEWPADVGARGDEETEDAGMASEDIEAETEVSRAASPVVEPEPPKRSVSRAAATRTPKPVVPPEDVRVVIKRGFVDYAEVKVGKGKAHVIPGRGAIVIKVPAGRRRVRWRTHPSGKWESMRFDFEPKVIHNCLIWSSGPKITPLSEEEASR